MRDNTKRGKNFLGIKDTYLVEGLNLDRFLLSAKNKGITLFDIKKINNKRLIVSVSIKESANFFAIAKELCYNIKKVKQKGAFLPLLMLWQKVGILVGGIIFCIACYINNDFIYGFNFTGSGSVCEREVLCYLSGVGVKPYTRFSSIDIEKLEDQILSANPNLSFVGITKKGNTLCFDLALANSGTDTLLGNVYCLKSDISGRVERIKVYRGTAVVKEGDFVNQNDLLVDGYMLVKDQRVDINVIATVSLIVNYDFTYVDSQEGQEQKATVLALSTLDNEDVVSTSSTCEKNGQDFVYTVSIKYRYLIYAG